MTRMWHGVDPSELCRQHLLGEHAELHQLAGTVNAGKRLGQTSRYVRVFDAPERHDALAAEMADRGMNHRSPMPAMGPPKGVDHDPIGAGENRAELTRRCSACRERMTQAPTNGSNR